MRAVEFIHQQFSKRGDLEQVAEKACLTKYHLSHFVPPIIAVSFN